MLCVCVVAETVSHTLFRFSMLRCFLYFYFFATQFSVTVPMSNFYWISIRKSFLSFQANELVIRSRYVFITPLNCSMKAI